MGININTHPATVSVAFRFRKAGNCTWIVLHAAARRYATAPTGMLLGK